MLEKVKEFFKNLISSRMFVLAIFFIVGAFILLSRIFSLQIVNGEYYLDNFELKIMRERTIPGTRGNIYDRNGNLLAYNELAYNIVIEDIFDDEEDKNAAMNGVILKLDEIVEKNGDSIISDFGIALNQDNQFEFSYTDTKHLRFLADIYGYKKIDELSAEERQSTPEDVVDYFCKKKKYAIGTSVYNEESKKNEFHPREGYTNEEILKLMIVRYNIDLNAFKKYVTTMVAADVSDETVAAIYENEDILKGVSVSKDTVRRYKDSVYFSQIIGYTGMISQEEYDTYEADPENDIEYSMNDFVGKTGMELAMEAQLQGRKGKETIYVNNTGKVLDRASYTAPVAGNDVYLTIDKDLQIAVYHLLEQKIAGILVSKIRNVKEYIPRENASASDIIIPIDDVYYALINNNVIDTRRFSKEYATDTEKAVYTAYLTKEESVLTGIEEELRNGTRPYNQLSKEYQVYESFIISMLSSDNHGIIIKEEGYEEDETYIAWAKEETISMKAYLEYCISKNWINTQNLDVNKKYSDSSEVYEAIVRYTLEHLQNNTEFTKKIYKYMIAQNMINGRQICTILWDQDIIRISTERMDAFRAGAISPYDFMLTLISNLEITPAQLALDPCCGSVVITDVNTGDVLALVSYPSYDNNRLANSADTEYLAKLNMDYSRPLWNYATQYRAAPGSCFKPVSAVAGLMEGVIDTGSTITCHGTFDKLTGIQHKCWIYPGGHGTLNVTGGIQNSCNCFFYEVGYRLAKDENGVYDQDLGVSRLAKYADLFGLSEKSGIEIYEAEPNVSGVYPVPSAIGQGEHAYTTVGMNRYITAVANNGTVFNLTLLDKVQDSNGKLIYDNHATIRNTIDIPNEYWDAVHLGLKRVVEGKAYFKELPVTAAGKTGTAQESKKRANHALFICYAPYESPQISVSTRIMNGYASDYAAQLTKDVLQYYFDLKNREDLITGSADTPMTATGGD